MEKIEVPVREYVASVFYEPEDKKAPVVYTHFAVDEAESVLELLKGERFALVSIDGVDWDAELSPWPEPKAFRTGEDFAGRAREYLSVLTKEIMPAAETAAGIAPEYRAIAGYSLSGLFALWSLYQTDLFSRLASMSGSLWYDGFMDFMRKNSLERVPQRAYFSLGDKESSTKNQRMAKVGNCTRAAADILLDSGAEVVFRYNEGGHFVNVPERIAEGLRWMLADGGDDVKVTYSETEL